MGHRRSSRELAMQAMYYIDLGCNDPEEAYSLFVSDFQPEPEVEPFFRILVQGTLEHLEEIDRRIESFSNNWKISRMSGVDRNVMRIAVYELLYCQDIPSKVSINEAIDIGKKFGTIDSGAFINGILDAISLDIDKNAT